MPRKNRPPKNGRPKDRPDRPSRKPVQRKPLQQKRARQKRPKPQDRLELGLEMEATGQPVLVTARAWEIIQAARNRALRARRQRRRKPPLPLLKKGGLKKGPLK